MANHTIVDKMLTEPDSELMVRVAEVYVKAELVRQESLEATAMVTMPRAVFLAMAICTLVGIEAYRNRKEGV